MNLSRDPHGGGPVLRTGASVDAAAGAVVLVHGRGGSADDMLTLASEIDVPDVAWLAPQAAGNTWYPLSFLAPHERNEPWLSSGLGRLASVVETIEATGLPAQRIALLGFSQGACLTLEFAARHARRYGAVIGLTGGLVGPPGTPRQYAGSFDDTPVFLGASDPDPHVPWERVVETADVLGRMGAEVTLERYPGLPHTIHRDQVERARNLIAALQANEPEVEPFTVNN